MTSFLRIPEPITPAWLTSILRQADLLGDGEVLDVTSHTNEAFNSHIQHLSILYSHDVLPTLPTQLVLKSNISDPWAIEAGAEEVRFYRTVAALSPPAPAIIPCIAAAIDPESGGSYLLLEDLSQTHAPPVTRDQQLSIVDGVPSTRTIERVVDALAHHHAYWWNHPLLATETFPIGYWSRNAERFALYLQRRQQAWESLRAHEAEWFPPDLRDLYDQVVAGLPTHWERYLEPRFRTHTHLTLVHGDSYFANFLCPKPPHDGQTYLLDWQSPVVDIAGYDLANLCATFWTSAQRHEAQREQQMFAQYYAVLQTQGVTTYTWEDFITDYQSGIIYWLLVPVQDRFDGAGKDYWWPKMQCVVAAFREWRCAALMGVAVA